MTIVPFLSRSRRFRRALQSYFQEISSEAEDLELIMGGASGLTPVCETSYTLACILCEALRCRAERVDLRLDEFEVVFIIGGSDVQGACPPAALFVDMIRDLTTVSNCRADHTGQLILRRQDTAHRFVVSQLWLGPPPGTVIRIKPHE